MVASGGFDFFFSFVNSNMDQLQLLNTLSITGIKKFDGTNFKYWLDEVKLWCDGCNLSDLLEITSEDNVSANIKKN